MLPFLVSWRLYTWLHCAEFPWCRKTTSQERKHNSHKTTALRRKKEVFTNYPSANCDFSRVRKKVLSSANFWQALSCVATSSRDKKIQQPHKLCLNSMKAPWQLLLSSTSWVLMSVMEMRVWASPSSSLLKATRIRQRNRGPLLSLPLSLSFLAASISLALSPSPSCFVLKFERWRTNYSRNF